MPSDSAGFVMKPAPSGKGAFYRLSVAAGLALGAAYTLAPLSALAIAAAVVLLYFTGRGLGDAERRVLLITLTIAFAARIIAIGSLVTAGVLGHADPSLGAILTGDEGYLLSRALRTRDIVLGFPVTKFDYFVAFDDYGRNSYLTMLSWLQVLFGPSPYGMRLLNAVIFTTAGVLLFGETKRAFGWLPAYIALLLVLFYPTLFVWSISLLKEPLYLLGTSLVLVSTVQFLRGSTWTARAWSAAGVVAGLAVVDGLRPAAIGLALSGIAIGMALREVTRNARRFVAIGTLGIIVAVAFVAVPALQRRAVAALETPAKQQAGHVFTVGHALKTLDDGFYMTPQPPGISNMTLTTDEAARYVLRSAASFVLVPTPWQIASARELAYLPEQFIWYAMVALAPFGIIAGWRRNALFTALLVGYVVPTVVAVALTSGNVGTMLRLRGLIVPFLAALTALGFCEVLETLASRRRSTDVGRLSPAFRGTGG